MPDRFTLFPSGNFWDPSYGEEYSGWPFDRFLEISGFSSLWITIPVVLLAFLIGLWRGRRSRQENTLIYGVFYCMVAFCAESMALIAFVLATNIYQFFDSDFELFFEITGISPWVVIVLFLVLASLVGFWLPRRRYRIMPIGGIKARLNPIVRGVLFGVAAFYAAPLLVAFFVEIAAWY